MNEWKELQIDNLPPDILTGCYEIELVLGGETDNANNLSSHEIIYNMCVLNCRYRYRKPEQKTPTHEKVELSDATKDKIVGNLFYLFHQFMTQQPLTKAVDIQHRLNLTRDAITNVLESSDIPPE